MTRNRAVLPVLAALAVPVGLAGCGGSSGDADADPAAAVPARAPIYFEATVRPEGDQKTGVEAAARKVLGNQDPGRELRRLFNESARDQKVTYEKDVEPWLGKRVGFFLTSFSGNDGDGAFVATAEDADKAQDLLDKQEGRERTYKDEKYRVTKDDGAGVVVDGYLIAGTEAGVKTAIDAVKGESLAESERFEQAADTVGDDGVGRMFIDPQGLVDAVGRGSGMSAAQLAPLRQAIASSGAQGVFATFSATDKALKLEAAAKGVKSQGGGNPAETVAALPGDSWLAAGTGEIGKQIDRSLTQLGRSGALGGQDLDTVLEQIRSQADIDVRRDLLAWMGDGGVFLRGTSVSDLAGALVVQSKSPNTTQEVLPKIQRLLEQGAAGQIEVSNLRESGVDEGFTVQAQGFPLPVHVAAAGDKFVVAVSDEGLQQALEPSQPLSDNAAFKSAGGQLGEGLQPTFYLAVEPLLQLAEGAGAGSDPQFGMARDALDAFTALVAGGKRDGDTARSTIVAGLK